MSGVYPWRLEMDFFQPTNEGAQRLLISAMHLWEYLDNCPSLLQIVFRSYSCLIQVIFEMSLSSFSLSDCRFNIGGEKGLKNMIVLTDNLSHYSSNLDCKEGIEVMTLCMLVVS